MIGARYFIAGGAGFLGSHFVDHLLEGGRAAKVTVFDNLSSGTRPPVARGSGGDRLHFILGDVADTNALARAMTGHDVVLHLASNPDIARAETEPTIDFAQGTALTSSVVEAMRRAGVPRILYASGSGVYGDRGLDEAREDDGPLLPISTYGASKLAGEALLASYTAMFGLKACVFRFGNIVGPRQTHGVGLDFTRRLLAALAEGMSPVRLRVLGDGTQSKSYVHVDDAIRAVMLAHEKTEAPFRVYNVATGDYVSVRDIAEVAAECAGLPRDGVVFDYTGGNRGWRGDVPIVRLSAERIRSLGWRCELGSREAMRRSMQSLVSDLRQPRT